MRKILKQMLPVIGITVIMIIISFALYNNIIQHEKDRCWQLLDDAAQSVGQEITMKFKDEIVKLGLVADMMIQEDKIDESQISYLHLETFQVTTIFSRIDVLYPDDTVLVVDGMRKMQNNAYSFDEIAKKGEHMSPRTNDFITGKECVYYCIPLEKNGEKVAILIGVVEADSLSGVFAPKIYGGKANSSIVDSKDGNFIMDSWHDELGNAYEYSTRKRLKEYENVDLKMEIRNRNTGVIAFVSKTTGSNLYMYYTPLDIFEWNVMVFVQEEQVFDNLIYTKKLLIYAELVEILLLILYFVWNLVTIERLEKSKAETESQKKKLEYISYHDMLTSVYNRNKYIHVLEYYKERKVQKTGVIYIDLNGLKQINDSCSHGEGDAFIRSSARWITEVFLDDVYRIGGDEFVVIDVMADKEEFSEKVKRLRSILQRENISVSVGVVWREESEELEEMLKVAEQDMYKEKQNYYRSHDRRARNR